MAELSKYPPSDAWPRRAVVRLRALWVHKLIGTTAAMALFFVIYFQLLKHPLFPVTVMPLIGLDRLIGFRPEALPLYLSLWVYVSLGSSLVLERRELGSHALAAVVLAALGLGVFFFWPTAVPPPDVDWERHPGFAFLKGIDASGNACPSLHVAFAVLACVWIDRHLQMMGAGRSVRILNVVWAVGIVYSTVAIRQHVALDALAGLALGGAVAWAHRRCLRTTVVAAVTRSLSR